jgi:hypothetical protein
MKYLKPKESKSSFFALFRKRGFIESLTILMEQPNHEISQKEFFNALVAKNAYPNLFFRVKSSLLDNKIIAYKLDPSNEKVIYLTEKGLQIMSIIDQIEGLIVKSK